jgi:hypothetical protein
MATYRGCSGLSVIELMSSDKMMPSCPICGSRVKMSALVESDKPGFPDDPQFWGEPGNRAIKCQKGAWLHFRVGKEQRLAYLRRLATRP